MIASNLQNIPDEKLITMLYDMLRIRVIEERLAELYLEREMRCPVHLCTGQEAVPVGVCAALNRDDYMLGTHRSHGHYLAKGGNLKAMVAELYGKITGCSLGKGGSMHLVDLPAGFLGATSIVGSTIPIAAGVAFGTQMQNQSKVTVVFFGDGATEEGIFHESLNFSSLKNLPIVFICENNFYSVYSPLSVRQPKQREIYQLARGHGLPGFHGNGNDVLEVYQLSKEAVERARKGGGPTFLEFKTYRWRTHCGGRYDNDLGYRAEDEFQSWISRCPIEDLKTRLLKNGLITEDEYEKMIEQFETEIADAVQFSRESAYPEKENLLKHIYAE
jgi:TPP-dependent pyruvate/acetoin dehydrogenase alpha subunit